MTYCVGLMLNKGMVLMSDTRTNSGVDNVSIFKKMFCWSEPGERIITLMTAGNLATTQAVVSLLDERGRVNSSEQLSILNAPTMFQVANIIGDLLRKVIAERGGTSLFSANIIVAGQIRGSDPQLFMVYPEGNFIEATPDTPFFQIGETKYGRPIIVRAYDPDMTFEDAVRLLMVSFDSTIKANLSVAPPLDMMILEKDCYDPMHEKRIEGDDDYFQALSRDWADALKYAYKSLPEYSF